MAEKTIKQQIEDIIALQKKRDPHQGKFLQALTEVLTTLIPFLEKYPEYMPELKKIVEPERIIQFRVPWLNDKGQEEINRGYRVQFNSAIGPYKGGLRLHPTVDLSTIKFLGFEQIFKNALTTLPMGGAKGGSDFDPKGKSDVEVMRFCQSFMTELFRHIGPYLDVPAGDIGVGRREIGYLFGQYKRLVIRNEPTLTGKHISYGGSNIRPEATGYGTVYFMNEMLKKKNIDIKGKTALVSGAGNVSQYAIEKLIQLGAKPITASDSRGYVYEPEGFTTEKLAILMKVKNEERASLERYAQLTGDPKKFVAGKRPWHIKGDLCFPCATENEVEKEDALILVKNGCIAVSEGANMPSNLEAIEIFQKNGVLYGPAKAANAGGVAVSGLEMSQNRMALKWTREKVDEELHKIMCSIFKESFEMAEDLGQSWNLLLGANCAGFKRVAVAMKDHGCV